jgi:hypothetical protein
MNPSNPIRVYVCGDHRLVRLAVDATDGSHVVERQWDVPASTGLDPRQREWFRSMDEVRCLRSEGSERLLMTSSWRSGAMLFDAVAGRCLWAVPMPNAHSACMTPSGRIVAAGAEGSDVLWAFQPMSDNPTEPVASLTLPGAHGVVVDQPRSCVWAAGADRLVRLDDTLAVDAQWTLPDTGAHDLSLDPTTGDLTVTTDSGVWRFRPAEHDFARLEGVGAWCKVKCAWFDEASRLWLVRADAGAWWSDSFIVRLHDGVETRFRLDGRKVYKVRPG